MAATDTIAGELNSLSTATVIDFYRRWWKPVATDAHYLRVSKIVTGIWGLFACAVAVWAAELGSLIEVVNRFGSFFYGSILGVFILAVAFPRATSTGAFVRSDRRDGSGGLDRGLHEGGVSVAQRDRRGHGGGRRAAAVMGAKWGRESLTEDTVPWAGAVSPGIVLSSHAQSCHCHHRHRDCRLADRRPDAPCANDNAMIRIFVTGGTFDKTYDEISGRLVFGDTHLPEMLQPRTFASRGVDPHADDGRQPRYDRRRSRADRAQLPPVRRVAYRHHPRHRHDGRDRARRLPPAWRTRPSC